ncbi:TorD/DmsD family molecular chaperone [Ottowia thiooxydans]|uniref:TorA maturation chaperone TorD n=1 Tax=Ottowia thiooxydans TaxID=219182 RepID=A0ABV2Q4X2_9BURK
MTNTSISTEPFSEEIARAELYGLLARLWFAPPDEALFKQFSVAVTQAPEAGGYLEAPWQALVAGMRETTVESASQEFAALFQSVGKPEVFPYGSYFLAGFMNEKPLAQLRTDLAALGLTRDDAQFETEDHIAYVFEVMRYLIAGDDAGVSNLEQQRRFFRNHVQTWVEQLCDAVDEQPAAQLWRAVAGMTRAFVVVEAQAFDLLEA